MVLLPTWHHHHHSLPCPIGPRNCHQRHPSRPLLPQGPPQPPTETHPDTNPDDHKSRKTKIRTQNP